MNHGSQLISMRKDEIRKYRKFRRNRNKSTYGKYVSAKKRASTRIESARSDYYKKKLSKIKDRTQLWKELENIGLISGPDRPDLAFPPDELNKFFISASNVQSSSGFSDPNLDHIPQSTSCFQFRKVTSFELQKSIDHFKSKAVGPDGISL